LTGDFTGKMSSVLGENRDKTRTAVNAAIPGILAGLSRATSTPDGTRRLTAAVDDADEGILGNLAGMFGKGFSSDTGLGILRSIMGAAGLSGLTNSIGRVSGFNLNSVSTMMGMLAPVVFSVLKKVSGSTGSANIANLLASQRAKIAAAMPAGMEEAEAHAGSAPKMTETYTKATAEPRSHRSAWLPLALLAGALGLIWFFGSRPHRQTAFRAPTTVEAGREDRSAKAMLSFDALKNKYNTVFQKAAAERVQITDVREERGKLVLKGTAPSQEAVDKVWTEIRRINPSLNDIEADFTIKPVPLAKATPLPDHSGHAGMNERMYTVKPGDSLSSISKHFYGNTKDYVRIVAANQNKIENKNLVHPGLELVIPE
jgi:nucleoid-associated protein YgaU